MTNKEPELYPKLVVDEAYIRDRVNAHHKREGASCSCGGRFPESLDEERLEKLFEAHLDYTTRNLLHLGKVES